jgi:hypothetical protein
MKSMIFLLFLVANLSCSGCIYAVRYDGEYRGKVFDGETKTPIEGAAVLGTWYTIQPTPAGAISHFYDARETLTDKNGEFSMPGMGLRVMSNLEPMSVMVFKAGYTAEESILWGSIETKEEWEDPIHRDLIVDKNSFPYQMRYTLNYLPYMDANGVANFPLRKLTQKEKDKREGHPSRPSIPENKMPLMTKEINKYRVESGLDAFTIRGDTK